MSCTPAPAILSCDTGQQIPDFDSRQLIINMYQVKHNLYMPW